MLKTPSWLSSLNRVGLFPALAPLTLGVALLTTAAPSVNAIPVVQGGVYIQVGQPQPTFPGVYGSTTTNTIIYSNPVPGSYIYSSPTPSNIIYGSPIPLPVPVNTGAGYNNYPSNGYYNVNPVVGFPVRGQVFNSTLGYPTLVNPQINDSVLINPVIVNPSRHPYHSIHRPRSFYGSPGNVRVFIRQ